MLYLSHSFKSRSIPTVAPKMPRDISVRSGIWPSSVLILFLISLFFHTKNKKSSVLPATNCIDVDAISYEHALRHDADSSWVADWTQRNYQSNQHRLVFQPIRGHLGTSVLMNLRLRLGGSTTFPKRTSDSKSVRQHPQNRS